MEFRVLVEAYGAGAPSLAQWSNALVVNYIGAVKRARSITLIFSLLTLLVGVGGNVLIPPNPPKH